LEKIYQSKIDIPSEYKPQERMAIAQDIVDFILKRTDEGKDKDNKSFPKYSKSYTKSRMFEESGKGKTPNLNLTFDMLAELSIVSTKSAGQVVVGYFDGSDQVGKVEGNILGAYGGEPNKKKARDFLGISDNDLEVILSRYPLDDREESKSRAALVTAIGEMSKSEAKKYASDLVKHGTIDKILVEEILSEKY